jgi:hypothetical protein
MSRSRRSTWSQQTPYYPSQQRGHQCLILDDRTVIGRPERRR